MDDAPPKAGAAAGGSALVAASALLSAPLPGAAGARGLKAHAFLDTGALADCAALLAPGALARDARASCGVGLALAPADVARVEVNCGWLLRSQPGDLGKRLSLGISATYGR